jgi:dTDP-4-amino-4,6-dideoxygalactose transaminase
MEALNQADIFPGVHYRDNTLYRMFSYGDGTCPRARQASEEIISLPLHLRLTDANVDRVIDEVVKLAAK